MAYADVFAPVDEPVTISAGPDISIAPDKPDYAPSELVTLTGGGWQAGESVAISVVDDGIAEERWQHDAIVTADADGNIVDSFNLPEWFVAQYYVTATGEWSGVATSSFTDATLPARGCPIGAPIVVTTAVDELNAVGTTGNGCSLREAIHAANADAPADTITLLDPNALSTPATAYTLTIAGAGEDGNATGDLDVTRPLTINGAGARTTIIEAGTSNSNGIDRVFHATSSGSLTLVNATVRHGRTTTADGGGILSSGRPVTLTDVAVVNNNIAGVAGDTRLGGGIENAGGTLTINRALIAGNSVTPGAGNKHGGGIHTSGTATLTNVTIDGNSANGEGAGLRVTGNTTRLTNVTVSDNAGAVGGGVRRDSGTLSLRNTLLSGNTATTSGANCSTNDASQLINSANNLDSGTSCGFAAGNSNKNAVLGSLQNNGGPTDTRALGTGSAAIDTGTGTNGGGHSIPTIDQRSEPRPVDGDGNASALWDIGAYEGAAPPASATITVSKDFVPNNGTEVTITLDCDDADVTAVDATTTDGGSAAEFTVENFDSDDECDASEGTPPTGYTANETGCQGIDPEDGDANCTITNTLNSATITVEKVYSPAGPTDAVQVSVDCGAAAGDEASDSAAPGSPSSPAEFTITGFDNGDTCTVSEQVPGGYTATYGGDDCTAGGVVTMQDGNTSNCTITNTQKTAEVQVAKDFQPDNGLGEVDVTLDCGTVTVVEDDDTASEADPANFTVKGFLSDTNCVATEDGESGYTGDVDGCDTIDPNAIDPDDPECTIVNTLNSATITVEKVYSDGSEGAVDVSLDCPGTANDDTQSAAPGSPSSPAEFTVTGFEPEDECTVSEDAPDGYAPNFSGECDEDGVVVLAVGDTFDCTITNVESLALVTAGGCTFDRNADRETPIDRQFKLIYTPQVGSTNFYKLNGSNPGQFFLNVAYAGGGDTLVIDVPYPFVTQGANPVKVYDDVKVVKGDKICFEPTGDLLAQPDEHIVLADHSPQNFTGSHQIEISLADLGHPEFVYVRTHLDYGLKGVAATCERLTTAPLDASCTAPSALTILNHGDYFFGFTGDSTSDSDTIENENEFKKNPGIGGSTTLWATGDPLPGSALEIWQGTKKVGSASADEDGWYMWPYKYTGKATTFTVKFPAYGLSKSVTMKANGFLVADFPVGQPLTEPAPPPSTGGGGKKR